MRNYKVRNCQYTKLSFKLRTVRGIKISDYTRPLKTMNSLTLNLFLLIFILSCTDKSAKVSEISESIETTLSHDSLHTVEDENEPISYIDSLQINNKIFIVFQSQNSIFITNNTDTVFSFIENINGAEFKDFNEDGFIDIVIHYITNVPGIYDLALFNPKTEKFNLVQNFNDFPSPEKNKKFKFLLLIPKKRLCRC